MTDVEYYRGVIKKTRQPVLIEVTPEGPRTSRVLFYAQVESSVMGGVLPNTVVDAITAQADLIATLQIQQSKPIIESAPLSPNVEAAALTRKTMEAKDSW